MQTSDADLEGNSGGSMWTFLSFQRLHILVVCKVHLSHTPCLTSNEVSTSGKLSDILKRGSLGGF